MYKNICTNNAAASYKNVHKLLISIYICTKFKNVLLEHFLNTLKNTLQNHPIGQRLNKFSSSQKRTAYL